MSLLQTYVRDVVLMEQGITAGLAASREIRAPPHTRVVALAVREVDSDIADWAEAGMSTCWTATDRG